MIFTLLKKGYENEPRKISKLEVEICPIKKGSIFGSIPRRGSGITISPNHVLTAGHNIYDKDTNVTAFDARTVTSGNEDSLNSRIIGTSGDPAANVTNVNFLADFNQTERDEDDIALLTTSDAPIAASDVVGVIAFVDPQEADTLNIETAGYPVDNVSSNITGNTGLPARDLVTASGTILDVYSTGIFRHDADAFSGQSGSGVWHTLDGDNFPRVVGVHTFGTPLLNGGRLITKDIYDDINAQIESDSGTTNANDLPENAIIGSRPRFVSTNIGNVNNAGEDYIVGSYRRERILGLGGDDTLLGGGADDRLEGGEGIDQALFSDEFVNYDFTITDPSNPAFEFVHARGTQADGTDTTKDIEFGVFEFVDANNDGSDDNGELFFVPLQVDPDDNTKLKDGAEITPEEDILDTDGNNIGTVTVESPAWMFDGDVNYTLTIGSEQAILYNFAFIIDSSGSMAGEELEQAQLAYNTLTQSLIDDGIAVNSEFAVIDFDSFSRLFAPLDAPNTISTINSVRANGQTNFNASLGDGVEFFSSPSRNNNATNITYFLSDGFPTRGGDFSANAEELQNLSEVRAFGIGNADLDQLNTIDSDNAVLLNDWTLDKQQNDSRMAIANFEL